MNLGQKWKSDLRAAGLADKNAKNSERQRNHQEEAKQIIAGIPAEIKKAMMGRHRTIRPMKRFITGDDVVGDSMTKVDALAEAYRDQALDLDVTCGTLRLVLEWCAKNGLEGRLVPFHIHMNSEEYELCVSPAE